MMKKITMIALIVLTALLGTQTNAQNGGDDCAGAVIVVPGIFTDTTITDNIPGNNNGDAAWFSYTASSDGFITVNSGIDIDTPDTRVFIYDNCTDLTELESDDDGGPGFTSTISDFPVTSGTEYIIAWDDRWEVDPFDWELSFGTCLDATNFVGIAGQTDVSFTWTDNPLATNGYSVAVYIAGADPDVDMPVVPAIITAQGDMTADLMGLTELTNYDAYIISDCDANGFSNGDNVFSFTTSGTPGPNATCDSALVITPDLYNATIVDASPGTDNGDSIWYSFTPDIDGFATISSCIGEDNQDTRVFMFEGSCDLLVAIDNDDDGCDFPDGNSSLLTDIAVVAGTEYFIQWDDRWSTEVFDWELTFAGCADPSEFDVDILGINDVTFTWTDVPEATNGYVINVFEGGADPTLDMPIGNSPIIVAAGEITAMATGLDESTVYDAYISSDCNAAGVSSGDEMINFQTIGNPGPNASCDTALVITPGVYTGQIVDANPGDDNGDSLWYSFTPTEDGTVTVSACFGDDNDDTRVFMSQGSCDALIAVADDDDGCGDPTNTFSSLLTGIPVVTGIEYFIQWDDRWSTDEFEWELMFEGTQTQMCDTPENLAVSNIGSESADFSWDIVADAFNGYTVVVYNEGDDPTDTAIVPISQTSATTNATVTGLEELTNYEAYVFTNCDGLDSELSDVAVAFTTVEILGFDDNSLLNISILPNPTTGIVTLNTTEQIQSLAVYSILGQEVLTMNPTATSFEINLSNVAAGTYFVKATSNGTTSVQKIIKE